MERGKLFGVAVLMWLSQALSIAASAQPANDACANATRISGTAYSDTEATSFATSGPQDPIPPDPSCVIGPCGDPGGQCRGKSVWYVFTAPSAGTMVADTFDSNYDTILSTYTGSCGSFQLVPGGCNDDDPLDGAQSKVSLGAAAGATYYFMISAFNNDGGDLAFHFEFSSTPTTTVTPTVAAATPTATLGPFGDANCDGRITAADLTVLAILISARDRAPCRLDDINGDGVLDAHDIFGVTEAIFEP